MIDSRNNLNYEPSLLFEDINFLESKIMADMLFEQLTQVEDINFLESKIMADMLFEQLTQEKKGLVCMRYLKKIHLEISHINKSSIKGLINYQYNQIYHSFILSDSLSVLKRIHRTVRMLENMGLN